MDFTWRSKQAAKFKAEAVKLAILCDEADAAHRREPTEESMQVAHDAGAEMDDFFGRVWEWLYAGGFQVEYDKVAEFIASDVKCETGIDIRIFVH